MDKNQRKNQEEETIWMEIKHHFSSAYKRVEDWMRPSKAHPMPLQIFLFVIKLPVLLLLLLLSPVVIVILIFVFVAAI